MQNARARVWWRERTQQRAVAAWAVYLARRRIQRLQAAQSDRVYALSAWGRGWEGLAWYRQQRQAKRRAAAVSDQFQQSSLLRRGLCVLR